MVSLLWLEGRKSIEESKEDDSYGPNIDAKCIASPIKDFRGYVVGGAADGFFLLAVEINFSSKTKITNFNGHILAEEEIA